MMSKVRAELKLKNDALLSAIEKKGYSQSHFARIIGVHPAHICDMVNLRYSPSENSEKELKISIALESDYETLFRPYLDIVKLKRKELIKNKYEALVDVEHVLNAGYKAPQIETPDLNTEDFEKDFFELLKRLNISKIQEKVLIMYFGLFGEYTHNLEEIGIKLNYTRERVRQIKERALMKLRKGDKREILSQYIGEIFQKKW